MKFPAVLCALIFLQGWTVGAQEPDGLELGEFFFRLFPVSERPNVRPRANNKIPVQFHLYESSKSPSLKRSTPSDSLKNNKRNYNIIDRSKMDEEVNRLNTSLPTMFIIHGFMENKNAKVIKDLLTEATDSGRWNVIFVDWRTLSAGPWYPFALLNVRAAGRYVANFIDSIAKTLDEMSSEEPNEVPLESTTKSISASSVFFKNLHVVGFSLGSHVAGITGQQVTLGRIGRITGLDPALPMIENLKSERLSKSSAEFVDVIHTAGGSFGLRDAIGHVDFYPNGGQAPQPGCYDDILPSGCSHWNAWRYFTESVRNENSFEALPCPSWKAFEEGECDRFKNEMKSGPVYMGVGTRKTARGKYYLTTRGESPYSMPL